MNAEDSMTGPLAGVRVLDLTTVILGPFATQLLGDLGADVVKIERPEGDSSRYVNPGRHRGMSGTAMNLHRNKRSLVLDLKQPEGREALLRLARTADVLIHNIRPGAMARLGLAYDDVRAVNPRLVYCAASGFSEAGPYGAKPAYDDLIQGASGMATLLAGRQGRPAYIPATICDKIAGISAVYAVIAALFHRERSGEGQKVEVPMFETMVAFNLVEHIGDSCFEPPAGPFGYARLLTEYRRPYRTADGYVCLLPYTDRHWQSFFAMSGRLELADDPRFADLPARTENVDALYAILEAIVSEKTTEDWLRLCEADNIPAMSVSDLADIGAHPQLVATGFFGARDHPSEGRYRTYGIPTAFSASPCRIRRDAPRLGEHSVELLAEAGYTTAEITRMATQGTTLDGRPDAPPTAN